MICLPVNGIFVMLQNIINGKESSLCVIIQDNVEHSGRGLLKAAIAALSQRVDDIHIFLFENEEEKINEGLPPHTISKIHYHDVTTNPNGWGPQGEGELQYTCDFCHYIDTHLQGCQKAAIVFDCLSYLIRHRSAPYTCTVLNKLMRSSPPVEQVVATIHGDVHDSHTLSLLHHCVTSVIEVKATHRSDHAFLSHTLHKKQTGKVSRVKEHVNISPNYLVTAEEDTEFTSTAVPDNPAVDPAANLTFNLSLSDKEQKARSQVVLPYTINKQKQSSIINNSVGQGKIFYQPDEADDFDEEDPDDDLDI